MPPESLAETSRRILGAEKENAEVKPGVSELPRKNTWQALSSSAKRAVSVDAEDTLGDIQQSYQAKCLDVLMKSSKMRARLDYEYFRGEDKIDNMVLGEGYSYLV